MGEVQTQRTQCFPLLSLLLALNITTVHYISLDVEGAEAGVLMAFPFDCIEVSVWTVEHREGPEFKRLYEGIEDDSIAYFGDGDNEEESTRGLHDREEGDSNAYNDEERTTTVVNRSNNNSNKEDEFRNLYDVEEGDSIMPVKDSSVREEESDAKTTHERPVIKHLTEPDTSHINVKNKHVEINVHKTQPRQTKKIVYVSQRDPRAGRDIYFVRFMNDKGYELYEYFDGDYTFIKRDTKLCRIHCPSSATHSV